jgi:hypothetical protein
MKKLKRNTLGGMASDKGGWLLLLWVALLGGCQHKQPEYRYLIVADIEGCEDCKAKLL